MPCPTALLALLLVTALTCSAQQPASPPAQPPPQPTTLRTQARLVVVDVVVSDKDHHPIHNLHQQDFSLLEGNTPQTINSFQEHTAHTAAEAAKFTRLPPMPPGVFSNYTPTPINSAVNILLLDSLNTPLQDQAYVRQQLLQYLNNARAGSNTAIFGLSTRLVMLQGFTSDPELLKTIVNQRATGKASPLLADAMGGNGMPDTATDTNLINGSILPPDVVANLQTFENINQSFQLQLRAKYTLDAMSVLARYLASIPGRKNLIWFSGSFPLNIEPDITGESSNPFAGIADSEDEYRDTTNLLARSQVAVYPIDARGLITQPMFSAAASGTKYAANPRAMSRDLQTFASTTANEHSTMFRMAQDTGGRAFVNTNGLAQAVQSAIDDGSSYYTLTYTPANPKPDGQFRKIQVKLAQAGYQLAYRHGYYADDPNSKAAAANPLTPTTLVVPSTPGATPTPDRGNVQRTMVHGVPGATQILYKVRILPLASALEDQPVPGNLLNRPGYAPAKPPFRRYAVDYAAVTQDIAFTATPDGTRHGLVQFVTLVYTPDGQLVNAVMNNLQGNLTPERYTALLHSGITLHQELSIPAKGEFSIRTGIVDSNTGHVGAAEIPLASIRNLPPLPTQPAPASPATTSTPPASTPSTPTPPHP